MQCGRNDEAGTAEGGVSTGDGGCNYTKDSKNASEHSEPAHTHVLYHLWCCKELHETLSAFRMNLGHEVVDGVRIYRIGNIAPSSIIEEIH